MCAPYSFEWMEYIEYYVVWFSPLYFRIWARLQNSVDSALSWYAPNRTFVALPLVVTNLDSSPLLKPPHRASMSKSLTSTLGLSPIGTQTIVTIAALRHDELECAAPNLRLVSTQERGMEEYTMVAAAVTRPIWRSCFHAGVVLPYSTASTLP